MTDVIDLQAERLARAQPRKGMGYEPPPTEGNWLSEMTQGTRFLARHKGNHTSKFSEFVLLTDPKKLSVVYLAENNSGRGVVDWHDPELFCQDYKYILTLEMEMLDGNGSPILNKPMVGDEEPQDTDRQS